MSAMTTKQYRIVRASWHEAEGDTIGCDYILNGDVSRARRCDQRDMQEMVKRANECERARVLLARILLLHTSFQAMVPREFLADVSKELSQ